MRVSVHPGSDHCGEIARVRACEISPEDFETTYVNRGMPVIITGLMDEWPAFRSGNRKWTFDFFKKEYGKTICSIDTTGAKEEIPLGEYLDRFELYEKLPIGSPVPYLRTWYFSDDIPDLVNDFDPPQHFHRSDAFKKLPEDLQPPFQWLFFGPRGTESKLHVDVWETDAWLGMLQGVKTFTLYHPAHRKFIERGENEWADLLHPVDNMKFPNQHSSFAAQADLCEGEVIYIPRRWPHHAVAQAASISLTLNFAPIVAKSGILRFLKPYVQTRARCQVQHGVKCDLLVVHAFWWLTFIFCVGTIGS
jgi:histone arginine demethylase JMJD6